MPPSNPIRPRRPSGSGASRPGSGESQVADQWERSLLARSALGAKWTVLLTGLSAAFALGTTLLLGRIGASTLGLYAGVLVTINFIVSFFFLGGENVVIYFLPRTAPDRKPSFLLTYVTLILVCSGLFSLVVIRWPVLTRLFLGAGSGNALTFAYSGLLTPAVILNLITVASLRAEMNIKAGLIVHSLVPLLVFGAFGVLASIGLLQAHGQLVIPLTMLGAYVASTLVGGLWARWPGPPSRWLAGAPYLPSDFWGYCLPLQLNTSVLFLFEYADQVLVLRLLGVPELGVYKAALAVAQVVTWFPMVLMRFAMYPTFANVSARGDQGLMRRVYHKAIILTSLWTALIGLWLLLLVPEITGLFGGQLATVMSLPARILVIGALAASPYVHANGAYLLAQGRTGLLLRLTAAGALTGVVLGYLGTIRYGVMGTALAHAASLVVFATVSGPILWKRFGLGVPGTALSVPLLAALAGLVMWVNLGIVARLAIGVGLTSVLVAMILRLGLVGREEILWVLRARVGGEPLPQSKGDHP